MVVQPFPNRSKVRDLVCEVLRGETSVAHFMVQTNLRHEYAAAIPLIVADMAAVDRADTVCLFAAALPQPTPIELGPVIRTGAPFDSVSRSNRAPCGSYTRRSERSRLGRSPHGLKRRCRPGSRAISDT